MTALLAAMVDWMAAVPAGACFVYLDLTNSDGVHTPLPAAVTMVSSPVIFYDGFERATPTAGCTAVSAERS